MSELKEMNTVMFDREAKEYVLITNGRCTLPHDNTDVFKKTHGENGIGACQYTPSEGIALRVIGEKEYAWTYRGVKAEFLSPVTAEASDNFKALIEKSIGRI